MVKFSSKIDPKVLEDLREFAGGSGRSICDLLTEAVSHYLDMYRVRPAFRSAMQAVLEENNDLLSRLAK